MRRSNQLKRFGVPMEEELLKPFDNFVRKRARRPFPRRSLTVRAQLVEERLTRGGADADPHSSLRSSSTRAPGQAN